MNSILATGLLDLGKNMIDRISAPKSLPTDKQVDSFNSELQKVSQPTLSSLRQDLLADPAIKNFLQGNKDNEIFLEKRADGSTKLLSSSGETMIIESNSPANDKFQNFFDRCTQEQLCLSPHRPNSVLLKS